MGSAGAAPAGWIWAVPLLPGNAAQRIGEPASRFAGQNGTRRVVVKKVVQAFLDEAIGELGRGNRLEFRDFGVFEIKQRAARIAQNPKTLERVQVPPNRTVKFKVGQLMKQKIQAPPAGALARSG